MSPRTPHPAPGTSKGALALVLHSHMPYVEGFGTWPFGEEWLWEAVATVYLPLLEVVRGHAVSVGLTPVLCDQLETLTGAAGERFLEFVREIRGAVHEMDGRELEERGEPVLAAEVRRAAGDYKRAEHQFTVLGGDLMRAFRQTPGIELWTSSATHAVLPLVATEPGRELQVSAGAAAHERRFGAWSGGFWLPECAYEPGLERELAQYGARCFCVDQTAALGLGSLDQLEPVATEAGPLAVPIDWQTIELIWSDSGYPSDPVYRDYHGRTTHDLRPWNNGGEPYDHDAALAQARRHAREFLARVETRLEAYRAERGRPGLLCCALDTELLGHWWYEGPEFLRELLGCAVEHGVDLVTLPDALERFEAVERPLSASTWGEGKDLRTWDSPQVADLLFDARAAELRTVAAAARCSAPGGPALERAARELLAAQASDWSFAITRSSAGDYPRERVHGHLAELEAALAALNGGPEPEPAVHNLAPELDLSPLLAP
jgi:1,4-alpha-glucan branching enzyme